MVPKDLQIVKTAEKLSEVDREYDKSLRAVSEKEQRLVQNANMLQLLQKQVRKCTACFMLNVLDLNK
jgi:hypothetical protein